MKGKMFVKIVDTKETIVIDCSDYDPSNHLFQGKNKAVEKDREGNTYKVSIDDPRYISGELVATHKDIAYGWNSSGEKIKTTTDKILERIEASEGRQKREMFELFCWWIFWYK